MTEEELHRRSESDLRGKQEFLLCQRGTSGLMCWKKYVLQHRIFCFPLVFFIVVEEIKTEKLIFKLK